MNRSKFVTQQSRIKPKRKSKMIKPKPVSTKYTVTVGKTWAGRWSDGVLGWGIGHHVAPNNGASMLEEAGHEWFYDMRPMPIWGDKAERNKVFLCKVTLEQIFDKNGRPIVRYKKKKGA